jgi:hypothetical protein
MVNNADGGLLPLVRFSFTSPAQYCKNPSIVTLKDFPTGSYPVIVHFTLILSSHLRMNIPQRFEDDILTCLIHYALITFCVMTVHYCLQFVRIIKY